MAHLNGEKVTDWHGIIARQQSSGVSAMRFCREESIPYWKFYYWKKRLAKMDGVPNEVGSEEHHASFAEICLVQSHGGPCEKNSFSKRMSIKEAMQKVPHRSSEGTRLSWGDRQKPRQWVGQNHHQLKPGLSPKSIKIGVIKRFCPRISRKDTEFSVFVSAFSG